LVANTLALQRAGVNRETPDPPGGVIERDEHGDPTGILRENAAMALVYRAIPEPRDEEVEHLLEQALRAAAANGLTSVHNMDTLRVHDALARLDEADRLPIRVTSYLQRDDLDEAIHRGLRTGRGSGRLTIGGLKLFADGSLGSMTALLLDDYQGHPGQRGIAVMSSEEMEALVRRALLHGLAPAIHAIGDAANRLVLDLYARVPRPKDLRLRLEHAQLLHPRDIPRLAHLGVVASMQPIHAPSDRPIAERLWGARSRFGYAWRSMLDSGVHLAFGSDCPVETIDPRQGIYAAVERRSPGDVDTLPWYPEQAITVQEAIAAYTRGAAYAAGREHEQGVITPGMRADLTILSHDIMACPPSEILQAKVVMTIVDGTIVDAW
jgi:predicted amidohydrolase YtcJ